MVNFSRGGYVGDWVLHILAAEAMLPYFRSAGCHNYARYAAFYVHHMKWLVTVLLNQLQWQTLLQRRTHSNVTMVYRIHHQLVAIPAGPPYIIYSNTTTRGPAPSAAATTPLPHQLIPALLLP